MSVLMLAEFATGRQWQEEPILWLQVWGSFSGWITPSLLGNRFLDLSRCVLYDPQSQSHDRQLLE